MGWSPQEAGKRSVPAATRVGATGFDRAPIRGDARGTPIPPELDFLVLHGVPSERLFAAVRSAPQGVTPLEVLLSEGDVSEETYYRALATRLGCAYYRGDPPFAANLDAVKSLRCGVAPLAGEASDVRAVIAPRGRSVSDLIERTLSGRLRRSSFAIASPQRLAALIRARQAEAVLNEALGRLPDALCARPGASAAQGAVAGLLATLAVMVEIANPTVLQTALSVGLWAIFLAAIMLRSMAAIANDLVARPRLLTDHELPVYTIVAPVYREAEVVGELVQALNKLDYPKSKLDIKIVAEQNDRRTLARLVELRLPACYEVIVAPPGAPQTKPRALNIALTSARGDLLTVYDAEDAPASKQLRLAASRFAADRSIDCLQARLSIRNPADSWLSNLFAVEYATLFDLINPGLCALKLPIALGGTSNHFRMITLLGAGGWDEWNVAEDADLGLRLARLGYRVASLDSETSEEAPHELANWFWQRVRWQKGWMQTCIVHSRDPLRLIHDLGFVGAAASVSLVLGAVIGALFWPAFAFNTAARAIEAIAAGSLTPWREAADVFVYVLALAGIWATVVPALVAAKQRGIEFKARVFALLPVYYILVCAAAWIAVFELALRPHYWAKTAHGRARRPHAPLAPTRRTAG